MEQDLTKIQIKQRLLIKEKGRREENLALKNKMCQIKVICRGEIDPKKANTETATRIREEFRKISPDASVQVSFINSGPKSEVEEYPVP